MGEGESESERESALESMTGGVIERARSCVYERDSVRACARENVSVRERPE